MHSIRQVSHVHVIDVDYKRRAQISRHLSSRELHTEIYEDTAEFLRRTPATGPVLINEQSGAGMLEQFFGELRAAGQFFPVTVYSDQPSPEQVVRAMRHGAVDYLRWPFDSEALDECLRRLFEEGDRRAELEREQAAARAKVDRLTQREREVLVSLLRGHTNKQVAEEIGISHRTVEIYRKNMMGKLQARTSSEAARIGIYAGLWLLPAA